jgi:hypothetical protein
MTRTVIVIAPRPQLRPQPFQLRVPRLDGLAGEEGGATYVGSGAEWLVTYPDAPMPIIGAFANSIRPSVFVPLIGAITTQLPSG